LDHIFTNVAGNEPNFNWIVGWFAQIVQQPNVKAGTSLVLRGKQGVGKTIVGQTFGHLLGPHYDLVADSRYVTGRFNSHMASLLLLHADEAFWAGDKSAEGKIKDLITGYYHQLEFKGVDSIRVRNYIRLFVTGNQDWLVPSGFGERRFAVFDVSEAKIQDHDYFKAIIDEMNNGGYEALLHYLLNFDLSKTNVMVIPRTDALLDQVIESLAPVQAWWLDTLQRGELPSGVNEPNTCPKDFLFGRYIRHARIRGDKHRAIATQIGTFLTRMLEPDLKTKRATANNLPVQKGDYLYVFPPLKVCRQKFADAMHQTLHWDDDDAEWTHDEDGELPW
jgi:hypothetical protein